MFIFRRKELLSRKTKKERIIVYDGRSPQVLYYLIEMCFYCDCFSKQEQGCHGQGKMKFFPDQGKVGEFCGWPGKFRKDLESQGKVREFEKKKAVAGSLQKIYSVQDGKGCIFSSPEHEVLMVSYFDQSLSVVRALSTFCFKGLLLQNG